MSENHSEQDQHFAFGRNWSRFLSMLNDQRIEEAERSLRDMLDVTDLAGSSFLDIGCGSGLFSLAARRLKATVRSFDYDPQSVACTAELRRRYFPDDPNWIVEQGSVLDISYLDQLGTFDTVYSWGVLHHTGQMWQALENVAPLVTEDGRLFIAIYNDQGRMSKFWLAVKRFYNRAPSPVKAILVYLTLVRFWTISTVRDLLHGKPFSTWRAYIELRGMSPWHDTIDWVGGYPFEVAKPEAIFEFFWKRGFVLLRLKTNAGGIGCNEFVFSRV